ncbi:MULTISPECIES: TIGR04540 family protein [Clostridium]|uniref:TIGR04540 family protein n=1 Tax=Clostridium cibarium TaxID=2762247 RepID=A0ABR8PR95_9CLOT|nr:MULTISPECIES: TIGR04540 family protein [Clostridium]MBD7910682.1 TIGR04540 family protein [Clostridium cibarium]
MRAVYKNPRELATCLKDLVDLYLDDLMSYEKLTEKILKIVDANEVYKNGHIESKLLIVLGAEREEIINKIVAERV